MTKTKCCVFASHINDSTNFDLLRYKINSIIKYVDKMIFVYSHSLKTKINENSILIHPKIKYILIENNGYDFNKYRNGLLSVTQKYDWYLLINDSFFFIKPELDDEFAYFDNSNDEFIGLINSAEIKLHYQSFFWGMNENIKNKFIKYTVIYKNTNDMMKLIYKIEVDFSNMVIMSKKTSCIIDHINANNCNKYGHVNGTWCTKYTQYVLDHFFPIVKMKRISGTQPFRTEVIDILTYLDNTELLNILANM